MQVSGAIAQTMATYTAGHAMLTALFAGKASSDQIAQCIVAATYKKIAQHGNAITTLTDKVAIAAIYKAAYTQCAPPSRRRALLSAEPAKFPSSNPADDAYAGIAAAFKAANPDSSNSSLTDDIWEQLATAMAAAENTTALEDAGADAMPAASQAAVGIAVVPAAPKAERKTASEASVGVAAISPSGVDAAVDGPAAAAAAAAAPKSANEVDDLFAAAARVSGVERQGVVGMAAKYKKEAGVNGSQGNRCCCYDSISGGCGDDEFGSRLAALTLQHLRLVMQLGK